MKKTVFRLIRPSVGITIVPEAMTAANCTCIHKRHATSIKGCDDRAVLILPVAIPVILNDIAKHQLLRPLHHFRTQAIAPANAQIALQTV